MIIYIYIYIHIHASINIYIYIYICIYTYRCPVKASLLRGVNCPEALVGPWEALVGPWEFNTYRTQIERGALCWACSQWLFEVTCLNKELGRGFGVQGSWHSDGFILESP